MPPTIISSRDFNQDLAGAQRAAKQGPVIVTERGEPAFVLMTHETFRRLSGQGKPTMVDLLRQADGEQIDFEPVRLGTGLVRPADLA